MEKIAVSSTALALRSEKPLTPAMISALWEISAVLDEERTPAIVPNSIWLTIPTARLRGPEARLDNVWLRECLERMTGLKLSGQHRGDEWGAVLISEWHITEGGSKARILIPPAGIHALRSPGNFVKIETMAAHRLPPHARRLYALLADRKRQRESYAQWSVANLRGLLGVDDKRSYDVWAQLAKRVLNPAVKAINAFGTVNVKMTLIKSGRSIAAVRFDWQWKDPHEATEIFIKNEQKNIKHTTKKTPEKTQSTIENRPKTMDPLTWWRSLTDDERNRLSDQIGHTFTVDKFILPRKERDFAEKAYAKHLEQTNDAGRHHDETIIISSREDHRKKQIYHQQGNKNREIERHTP